MNSKYFNKQNYSVVAATTVSALLLGWTLGSTVLLKYKSEGILSVDMGVSEFKRFAESAGSVASLRVLASAGSQTEKQGTDAATLAGAEELVKTAPLAKWLVPVPRMNKAEAKDLPDMLQKLEFENANRDNRDNRDRVYMGVRLTAHAADAQQAARTTEWLGQYFKETATREALREQVFTWVSDNRQFSDRAAERRVRLQFDIEQAQTRAKALQAVLKQYPQLAQQDARQVVDVRKDNEKFISPLSQLIGAESEVIEIKEKLAKLDREAQQQSFARAVLDKAQGLVQGNTSGSQLVQGLSALLTQAAGQVKTEAEREKLLSMTADVSKITARFLSQAQFVVAPSVPERSEQPRPKMLAAVFALLGLLASLLWVFKDALLQMLREEPEEAVR